MILTPIDAIYDLFSVVFSSTTLAKIISYLLCIQRTISSCIYMFNCALAWKIVAIACNIWLIHRSLLTVCCSSTSSRETYDNSTEWAIEWVSEWSNGKHVRRCLSAFAHMKVIQSLDNTLLHACGWISFKIDMHQAFFFFSSYSEFFARLI